MMATVNEERLERLLKWWNKLILLRMQGYHVESSLNIVRRGLGWRKR